MLNSKKMYRRSKNSFLQSQKAFEAEITIEPFYSVELGFKMLSTSAFHMARCAVNLGLALYCIPNMLAAACNENDSDTAFENGFAAIGWHLAAAAIDFANIFFTMEAVLVRAIITLVEKCESNEDFVDRSTTAFAATAANSSFFANLTPQGKAYNDASALEFSPSSFSI